MRDCDTWRGFGLDMGFIDHLYTHTEQQAIKATSLFSIIHKSHSIRWAFSSLLCLHQPFPGIGF
jgi:hypothetical protein